LSQTFLIPRIIQRDIINVLRSACNVPVSLVIFTYNFNFLDTVPKNTLISNFTEILRRGTDSFHTDGQADRQTYVTKPIVTFHNFVNAPENKPILR